MCPDTVVVNLIVVQSGKDCMNEWTIVLFLSMIVGEGLESLKIYGSGSCSCSCSCNNMRT